MSVLLANQVDPPTAEIGQEYEMFNEGVIASRGYSNACRAAAATASRAARAKPLPPQAFGAIMKGR
jgi:hypothetical protein